MNGFGGLRVAVVGPMPPAAGSPDAAGGMANQTRQLAELLATEGAQVEVVATNARSRPAWVASVPMLRALARLVPYLAALWRAAGRNDLFHVMANSGWAWHLFAAPAIWLGSARGATVVVNYRGGEAAGFLLHAAKRVRWSMRRAALLVVPSTFLKGIFDAHGMPAEVVPNVVDLTRFRPAAGATVTASVQSRGGHVVVTRNLEAIYDVATALRAFALLRAGRPEARLSVAGSGPEAAMLQGLAAQLGIGAAVHFTGPLGREAMADLYREADVCLNASIADNSPNALLEALASGVPVVSTNVGGVPHLVEHGSTALLVVPRDPAAMAQALALVLRDGALRERLARQGLRQVRRHTWAQVAPRWLAAYRSALGTGPAAPVQA